MTIIGSYTSAELSAPRKRRTIISKYGTVYATRRYRDASGRLVIEGKEREEILREIEDLARKQAEEKAQQESLEAQRIREEEIRKLEEKRQQTLARREDLERAAQQSLILTVEDEEAARQQTLARREDLENAAQMTFATQEDLDRASVYQPTSKTSPKMISKASRSEGYASKAQQKDIENKVLEAAWYQWQALRTSVLETGGAAIKGDWDEAKLGLRRMGNMLFPDPKQTQTYTGKAIVGFGTQELLGQGIWTTTARAGKWLFKQPGTKRVIAGADDFIKAYRREVALGRSGKARLTPARAALKTAKKSAITKVESREAGIQFAKSGQQAKQFQKSLQYPSGQYSYKNYGRVKVGKKIMREWELAAQKTPKPKPQKLELDIVERGYGAYRSRIDPFSTPGSPEYKGAAKIRLTGKEASASERKLKSIIKSVKEEKRQLDLVRAEELLIKQRQAKRLLQQVETPVAKPKKIADNTLFDKEVKFQVDRIKRASVKTTKVSEGQIAITKTKPVVKKLPSRPLTVAEPGEKAVKEATRYATKVRPARQQVIGSRKPDKAAELFLDTERIVASSKELNVAEATARTPKGSSAITSKLGEERIVTQKITLGAGIKPVEEEILKPATESRVDVTQAYREDMAVSQAQTKTPDYLRRMKIESKKVKLVRVPTKQVRVPEAIKELVPRSPRNQRFARTTPPRDIPEALRVAPPTTPLPPNLNGRRRGGQGYEVYLKRFGKFQKASNQVFTEQSAQRYGRFIAGTTAGATFKLVEAIGNPQKYAGASFPKTDFYRKAGNIFVEKREKRIKTKGELKEITFKGQKTRRKKSRGANKWLIF